MSKTDNTTPPRLWDAHGLVYHRYTRYCWFTRKSETKWFVQRANRRDRRQAREQLRRGEQPLSYRRRPVEWDVW